MPTVSRESKFRIPHSAFRIAKGARTRGGFTLIELMVVVVIIGVLAAIIVPAIGAAVTRAREAKVIVEINGLSAAIATFKSKYGVEPPSQMIIFLSDDPVNMKGWSSPAAAPYRAIIRSMWPQFNFSVTGGGGTLYPKYWDSIGVLNAGGDKVLKMNAGECLLFFLGGVMDSNAALNAATGAPTGFAKNPLNPFTPRGVLASREGPFFEFANVAQLSDVDNNGIGEWKDPLPGQTSPYLYFNSYEGSGYHVTGVPSELPAGGTLLDVYRVWSPSSGGPVTPPTPGVATKALGAQKPQSFQIISPGYDKNYGSGGVFNINLANSGLTDSSGKPDIAAYDNLTNFNGSGRLKP